MKYRWLCLSDIHYLIENYDINSLREKLLKYLEEEELFDFVIITGDLMYQNKYNDSVIDFLKSIKNFIRDYSAEKYIIVPGNHDYTRTHDRTAKIDYYIKNFDPKNTNNAEQTNELLKNGISKFSKLYREVTGEKYHNKPIRYITINSVIQVIAVNSCMLTPYLQDPVYPLQIIMIKYYFC